MSINIDELTPRTKLRRNATSEALTKAGFPTSESSLSTMATRGGGPPFEKWGRIPLYTWGTTLEWAKDRLSEPVHSTSEFGKTNLPRLGHPRNVADERPEIEDAEVEDNTPLRRKRGRPRKAPVEAQAAE